MGIQDVNCPCSPEEVDRAFRESEPYIEREIADRSYRMRRYLADYAPVKVFPDGVGYTLSKVRFFGDPGPQYDGFDGWRQEQRSRSAYGHQDSHDACGYVWEEVGHGFEELHYHLMKRDLKTVQICVEDIRTFWEFEQYQNLIFRNLTEITANMKEQLNRNALIGFAVKHVLTGAGLEVNAQNPYELPNISGVTVGKLSYRPLKRLYNALLREAGTFALTVLDGRPVFGLIASDDTIDDMYLEDPEIRVDLRESSMGADELLNRYNFRETIRGLFLNIPDMYAPRYRDDGNGNLIRVFPYERAVAIQSGTRPAPNPDYENAPYELVLVMTRDVFALRSRVARSTVGGETDFNAETGMFEWRWHNPERWCDPNRRLGFYFANGRLGIEPGDFTDIPGILVRRRPKELDTLYWPNPDCPPVPAPCNNDLADNQGCPCPQIVDCCEVFTDPNSLQFKFSQPITEGATDPIAIRLNNGGVANGTVTSVAVDGLSALIDFGEPVSCSPGLYIEVDCEPSDLCSSKVIIELQNSVTPANRDLQLAALLRATAIVTATVSAHLDDGSYVDVIIQSIDSDSRTYQVSPVVAGSLDGKCIEELCVPPALDAACPACAPATTLCDPVTGLG